MPTVTIKKVQDPDELYCRYDGQFEPQRVSLDLDTRDGEMSCSYWPEVGMTSTFAHHHRLILEAPIPALTADAANALMEELRPLAQLVLDGADQEWDGNNFVGVLTDAACAAWDEIVERCADDQFEDRDLVVELDVADWFTGGVGDIGLYADTTDEELDKLVDVEVRQAQQTGEFGVTILPRKGVREVLVNARAELREEVREELKSAAATLAEAERHRNELIRRIKSFGVDTDTLRSLGELAGISHTEVSRILKERTFTVALLTPTGSHPGGEAGWEEGWEVSWRMPAYRSPSGVPLYAAPDVLATQTVVDPNTSSAWKVGVWDGIGADTTTTPLYVYTPEERHRILKEQENLGRPRTPQDVERIRQTEEA